ncbi:cupin [Frateuria sp. Soil773]|uniref:AraC family transcriptional regulator n=1 Tax=Frateuria sp. Soil773 TaxID=1736407 RepID=UPI0006F93928|nr:AraC family transcriptional regulator [Frateuria sp. Soil773]KRE89823.1 cupin [Frateuria sp. Soil773]
MRPPTPWSPADPLDEALHLLRMSGVFYCRSEFAALWGLALPPLPQHLMFHVVTAGTCWLKVGGCPPRQLHPGDFVLLPHGTGHELGDVPGTHCEPLFDLPREKVSERYEVLRHGGDGTPAHLICGAVRFDHAVAKQLVDMLPLTLHISPAKDPSLSWMSDLLRFMAAEARNLRPGGDAIVSRLADILVIQAIRSWIETVPGTQAGWLHALRDRQIGQAIALIHRRPEQPWTLASLAEAAAMSRSAFSARFTALVGMPAMQYVAQWRMQVALTSLRERNVPVGTLAGNLGYQSEAAFTRAFKRHVGMSPSAARTARDADAATGRG